MVIERAFGSGFVVDKEFGIEIIRFFSRGDWWKCFRSLI